jgi:hypothetical protein
MRAGGQPVVGIVGAAHIQVGCCRLGLRCAVRWRAPSQSNLCVVVFLGFFCSFICTSAVGCDVLQGIVSQWPTVSSLAAERAVASYLKPPKPEDEASNFITVALTGAGAATDTFLPFPQLRRISLLRFCSLACSTSGSSRGYSCQLLETAPSSCWPSCPDFVVAAIFVMQGRCSGRWLIADLARLWHWLA